MRAIFFFAAAALAATARLSEPQQHLHLSPSEVQRHPSLDDLPHLAPRPLDSQNPLSEASARPNIFHLHGQLCHYFANPTGFGVNEYPLPHGAKITHLHMLHRHGARYPVGHFAIVDKLESRSFRATGDLEFLNTWKNKLGMHNLVPLGKKELFDSGVLHQKLYGHLYPKDGSKIVARSTTQNRMVESAESFLAGFFGDDWQRNATLQLIIEKPGFNNSLAGYYKCPNSGKPQSYTGSEARHEWTKLYLSDAKERLNNLITFEDGDTALSISDVYAFQSLCAYETVAYGHSDFCRLFTYEEWQGYDYSVDISFAGNNGFQSPTGRGIGIGYVQELRARLHHHYLTKNGGPANLTLDGDPATFPLNQTLYLDFSHDVNIMSIITALGLVQFNAFLPATHRIPHDLVVSHMEPFAARLDMEIIAAPRPVPASRSASEQPDLETDANPDPETSSDTEPDIDTDKHNSHETTYIHFLLNERTVPLGRSFKQCGARDDGWCELGAFLDALDSAYADSQFDFACFGEYPAEPYGTVTNGVPVSK